MFLFQLACLGNGQLVRVGVLEEVNRTCHGVSFDMCKQTRGGEGQYV